MIEERGKQHQGSFFGGNIYTSKSLVADVDLVLEKTPFYNATLANFTFSSWASSDAFKLNWGNKKR